MAKNFGQKVLENREKTKKDPLIEAGELGHEMGKGYMKDMQDMILKHRILKGHYYIYVYHHADFLTAEAQKVVMCSGREEHLPQFKAKWGCDLWKMDNDRDKLELLWSLPSFETLHLFTNNPDATNKQLMMWIKMHQRGEL